MLDPEKQAQLDQAFALMADNYPAAWRRLYEGLLKVEFSSTEALKLVQTFILSQSPYGIRGADG
jgi:hypothetical protein